MAGEIREAWPHKRITILDPREELLPGFLAEVRDDLRIQLGELGIELCLGTALVDLPPVEAGIAETFTAIATDGEEFAADIWFRSFGARVNTEYLGGGGLVELTERRTVPVDEHLNVIGHDHIYALGDIADLPDAKMATHAQTQALVVAENIRAQLHGGKPEAVYEPAAVARILLPLGTGGGVGQLPHPNGHAVAAPRDVVVGRKGKDLFTSHFSERFNLLGDLGDRVTAPRRTPGTHAPYEGDALPTGSPSRTASTPGKGCA